MLLHDFLYLTHNKSQLVEYLCEKGVIRKEITCPNCNTTINITYESDVDILHCTIKNYVQIRRR